MKIDKKKLNASFQEQNKKFFLFITWGGALYPPEAEIIVKNKWLRKFLWVYSVSIWFTSFLYLFLWLIKAATTNVPLKVFLILIRRTMCVIHGVSKIGTYLLTPRLKKLDEIFHCWNNDINVDYYKTRRYEILQEKMARTTKYYLFSFIVGVGLLQAPGLTLLFNRYAKGAALTIFYHNPAVWYHPILLFIQMISFLPCNVTGVGFNTILLFLLSMANAQLELLKEALSNIFSRLEFDDEQNLYVKEPMGKTLLTPEKHKIEIAKVRRDLGEWIKMHKVTNDWLDDLAQFLTFTSTAKLTFLGAYVCLAVFCMPGYIKNKEYLDVFYVLFYSVGYFPGLFYESRMMDEVFEASNALFDDVYATVWSLYPRDITQSLAIIAGRSICRPFQVFTYKIFPDNSESFMAIMQTAYNALSFLMQMDI